MFNRKERRRYVVVGAGGFFGGYMVNTLLNDNNLDVMAIDSKPIGRWLWPHGGATNLELCIPSREAGHVLRGADVVFDMAANVGGAQYLSANRIEVFQSLATTIEIAEAAYNAGVKKFFFPSTALIGMDKNHTHCIEKRASEELVSLYWREKGMETYIARFHGLYGPHCEFDGGRERVIPALCRKAIMAAERGEKAFRVMGDGNQRRRFIYATDACRIALEIVNDRKNAGKVIHVKGSESVRMVELAQMISDMSGNNAVAIADTMMPECTVGDDPRDYGKLKVSLEGGIADTYNWIESTMKERMYGAKGLTP